MNPSTQISNLTQGRFRVGDHVRLVVGFRGAEVEILEDHGPLGVGGRRFYTIRMNQADAEDLIVGCREDELEPLPTKNGRPSPG